MHYCLCRVHHHRYYTDARNYRKPHRQECLCYLLHKYHQEDRVIETVATDRGPKAIGPYSQAVRANGFVFLSGQIPLDPNTQQLVEGDAAVQTERVLENLKAV